MALILVIGLALFAFVLDPSSIEDFFNSTKVNSVGEVDGETISRKDFSEALEAYKSQVGNRLTDMQASKQVWENLVREKIYQNQLIEAGIKVGENDVWNALIENPSVKNNQQFFNALGLFDEGKLKEYLALAKSDDPVLWGQWSNFMGRIKTGLENSTYNELITAGLGASLKEGEVSYLNNNTKITSQFVYVPFTSIADSLVTVNKSDIEAYIKENPTNFKVETSSDIKYVKFDITPTKGDEDAIQTEVADLLNDKDGVKGLRNTQDATEFILENNSDVALDNTYNFKNTVSVAIAEEVFKGKEGDVFGPYKDRGYFKVSKVTEVVKLSDSVKAAHILIPFIGSASSNETTTLTEQQAKKSIDSIYKLVRRNKKKFASIADEMNPDGTKGKGGAIDWIALNAAFSLDQEFGDALFFNKKGAIKVVKTKFGYHIIRVDDVKKKETAVKLSTFARKIEASQATENTVFQNAETFALALANGGKFTDVVKEKGLKAQAAFGLKVLDENVPGVGNQRGMVTWANRSENKVGDYKRFDTNNGHVVAVIVNRTFKGLMSAAKAAPRVRPVLMNEKKAELLADSMKGATLQEIAKETKQTVRTASAVSLQSAMISGVGFEPKIVGAMFGSQENTLFNKVEGNKGVFAFVVTKREKPVALPNYDSYRKRIADTRKGQTNLMYDAIKDAANVEDNRAMFYGVE
jgi:peptidylprolyl isomerase/peptidyl-prolyl cis-trans isomerase D